MNEIMNDKLSLSNPNRGQNPVRDNKDFKVLKVFKDLKDLKKWERCASLLAPA
jgi:hypothetical protein